ncbi:MAG: LptE family protein [Candidatus Omnitrophota bacterium]|nr:LptE family protein [Candidatus Omnitrophota bacterium]MDZ4242172.1 LptE family protein [Candidatus Omnitrophota bacterium]
MKRYFIAIAFLALGTVSLSCGYSARSGLSGFRTIYVDKFKNSIDFTAESRRRTYFPLLEVKVHKSVIDRFIFNGSLRIAEKEKADLVLTGEVTGYDRNALRYTDNDDVQEYRVYVVMNLTLTDPKTDTVIWEENGFTGEATYFLTGSQSRSESAAVDDAITDLARRVVERTIENW